MTEDTPTPDQAPEPPQNVPAPDPSQAPIGEAPRAHTGEQSPADAAPVPPVPDAAPAAPADPEGTPAPEVAPAPDAPPAPPVAPNAWPPSDSHAFPTPEEDAALREERAKRFGGEPAPAGDQLADPDPATQALPSTQESHPPAPAVVTPVPASPASRPGETPFPPTTQMPAQAPVPPAPVDDFEGFEEQGPVSRAAAHWWTILITLVFAPVAWYLFTDGGVRITWALSQGEVPTVPVFIEFGLGLVALFIYLLAARWSSVGSIILGSVFLALGAAFLVVPEQAQTILVQSNQYFGRLGQFGLNVLEHLVATLESGRMAVYGLTMIMVGVVSHGARRQGRREERTKISLGE